MSTTIRIKIETEKRLKALKRHKRETLDDAINRLNVYWIRRKQPEISEIGLKLGLSC